MATNSHHFLVLHFGVQCPWQPWVAEQAREAAKYLSGRVDIVDVTRRPDLAARYRLFFPFMIIVDETTRLLSLTPAKELVWIIAKGYYPPPLDPVFQQPAGYAETIIPLTAANIGDTCHMCIHSKETRGCRAKTAWAAHMACLVPDGILGFSAYDNGQAVGGVEFLPAALVPYPLPLKAPDIAFISCLYSIENGIDYRGQVLERFIQHLRGTAYQEVQVIAGKRMPYPNGPEDFFTQYGFHPVVGLGRVTLREGEEELILLRKKIGAD